MDKDIPELGPKELREFAWIFSGIVIAIFGVVLPWLLGFEFPVWPWIVGICISGWGTLAPRSIRHFYVIWMKFGFLLNAVMSRVVLGIVFYLVVLPTGMILKIRKKDPMRRGFDKNRDTYRETSIESKPEQMEKPF